MTEYLDWVCYKRYKSMSFGITVVIVTRNRPAKLKRCLESLSSQSYLPEKVLVIDNDIKSTSYSVAQNFKEKLNLEYYLEYASGVPHARNTALNKTKSRFLGFVDDDCILDEKWVEIAINTLKRVKGITYICGKTKLYNNNNILALAQHTRDSYWYIKKLKNDKETTQEHFDTKNVVFDKEQILAKGIKFDENCRFGQFDSADFDFGIQLATNSLKGIYISSMKLMHEETNNLQRFIIRGYYRGKIAGYINEKWSFGDKLVDMSERNVLIWLLKTIKNFPLYFKIYTKNLNISIFRKILLICLIRSYEAAYLMGYIGYKKKAIA